MTTAQFTLQLICIHPSEKERLAYLESFFELYQVTEKPPLRAAMDADNWERQQLTQSEIQQHAQSLASSKLPANYFKDNTLS